jgi:Zn-finger nucleic acid-binding protein
MTYRDQLLSCPRCAKPLHRRLQRESWPCPACEGIAIDSEELTRLLARLVPELATAGVVETSARATSERALICAACGQPMTPVQLHGVPLDRCYRDELIWFDADKLDRLLDAVIADAEARKGWAQKLRDLLFAN